MSEQALEIMKPLFKNWPSVRWNKCLKLYELARKATGPIVELGAYTGNGTIALALGSKAGKRVPVYGVDQWQRFTGLYQQQFYPEDYDKCVENIETANVDDIIHLVKGDLREVADRWSYGKISLLVWDVSLETLYTDFIAWVGHIEPGGLFVAKDTTVWDFGMAHVMDYAKNYGWELVVDQMDACLWGIRKPNE